jgi:hypothetical protein
MAKGEPMRHVGVGTVGGMNPSGNLGPSARQSNAPQGGRATSPPPPAGASPRASVVVQGMLAFSNGSKRELWCTEAATTVTVRRADHVQLEVSGQIALSSKAMPSSTTALCLCLVEQSQAPTAPVGGVESTADAAATVRTQSAPPSYEVWTSWTSGHVVIIDAASRDPVEYVRWDPPHPIHSFVYLPQLAPGPGGSGAVGPGLVVGIALDGCLSIWDVSDRRVVASLAVTVGSKCPLTAVVGTNSTGTASGHYVYCGFDDGSIRCFLVRTQLLAGPVNAPRRYKATMEVAESRCLYDVHRGSVLSLIASQGPKLGSGPSAAGGAPASKVVLTLWSGGEDGTLRKTTFAGVSSAVKSTIILQSGSTAAAGGTTAANTANYFHKLCLCGHHLVACSNDGSVSILSAVGDHGLLQRVQFQQPLCVREIVSLPLHHLDRMSEDVVGTSTAQSSVRRVVLSLSDGSLRNVALRLSEGEMQEVMELDRMRDVAVSPASPDRSRGLVSPTGQHGEYGSPPVSLQQQQAPSIRAGTTITHQASNLATGFSPEERPRAASPPLRTTGNMNWQQTVTDRSNRNSHYQPQSSGHQVRHSGALQLVDPEDDAFLSDEERLMMQEEQCRLKEQQRPKTPPPQELIQVVLKIMFELRKTEDEETAKRVDMWRDFVAELDYTRDVMNFTFWRPFIGGVGLSGSGSGRGASPSRGSEVVATASRALIGTILAEKISIEADFVRQRDEMRSEFWRTQRTLFKLSTIIPELKLHRQIILDAEREEFMLLQHLHGHMRRTMPLLASPQLISELRREVADLNADVAARDKELEQLREVEKQLEKVTHERDRTQKLLADLQSLVQEQRQAVHSSNEETVYLVQEHRRVLLNGLQQQEVVNRRTIVSHWEEFWREHIFTQLHRLQSLQMEGVGIEMQVAKSGSVKHANEVAALRQVIGDLERKLRAVELKLSAAEHHVSKAEHEKAAFADEAAAYRLRLAHSEAELQAVRDRQGSSTTETMLVEQRLATTLALAEESCQTVVEQQGIIAQLNGRLQSRQAAVAELLSLLESQLISGVEPPWLSEARSLLRDVMYDLAAARRGSGGSGGVAGDYNRAVSPRRHADPSAAMELLGPSPTTLEKLSQAFEKVKQSLERCLEPGSHRHLHLERASLSELVRRVQTEMELPTSSSFARSISVTAQRRDATASISISSTSPRPGPVSPPASR